MRVRFWGTRGSIAKAGPGTVRYGGNTSCVEIRVDDGTIVVLDCGTGAHALGESLMAGEQPVRGHLLISHTHWDHIQGLPFFAPLFNPTNEWDIYAPRGLGQSLQDTLAGQMQYTYFPVTLEDLGATIHYHDLIEGVFEVGGITVHTQYLNHPALALGYRLEADGAVIVYACDHEPHSRQLAVREGEIGTQDRRHMEFLRDADLVIHDAQYTIAEYPNRVGWGHSTVRYAADMCRLADVKRLALSHHDPLREDDDVDRVVEAARATNRDAAHALEIFGAAEGAVIELRSDAVGSVRVQSDEPSAIAPVTSAIQVHTILLGVGDPETAALITGSVEPKSIRIVKADNREMAVEQYRSDLPSLVILDEALRGGSALEICHDIRQIDDNAYEVPIIVAADETNASADAASEITDWLIKPFSREYVRTRIMAWVLRQSCRWVPAPLPPDEDQRLATLHDLDILDTEPEERFDRITRLAAAIFDVPVVLISFIDRDRQWFKSAQGIEVRETPRDKAFCAHTILKDGVTIVPDALLDDRFADNPFVVGDTRIRFYAGHPLTATDGSHLGTLCLIDTQPRQINDDKVDLLKDLTALVQRELSIGASA